MRRKATSSSKIIGNAKLASIPNIYKDSRIVLESLVVPRAIAYVCSSGISVVETVYLLIYVKFL